MRLDLALAAVLAGLPPAAASAAPDAAPASQQARGVDDPRAFVAAHYETYRRNSNSPPVDPEHAYSDRLRALFAAYDAWTAQHEDLVGSLAFDWWTNSQDWRIDPVELSEVQDGPDRQTIVARFRNWDEPTVVRFRFVRERARWHLDDASSGEVREGWVLSELLRERPE